MTKRLILLLIICIYSVDSFSTHAAGMDISYQCLTSDTVFTGDYQVNISTAAWGNECSWNIVDNAGNIVASGSGYASYSNYTVNVCLPAGSYTFNWYDSFGDGWNGGNYNVITNTGTVLTSGSPLSGSFGSSSFVSPGSSCSYNIVTYPANTYRFTVKFYRDCDGISAPSSLSLDYSSSSCGINSSISLNQVGPGVIITPICPSLNTTCDGGTVIGIEEYTYESIITLSTCNDWVFSVEECCRNNAITTINNPGNEELRIEATLDNTQFCNSSPTFSQPPVPYICANTPFCYNNGAIDAEGDSLVYSLITPLTSSGTVTYNSIFSTNNPVSGFTNFSTVTGNLCVNPPLILTSVVAIKVDEYRNGILIGSIIRDIQINVLTCNEPPPYLTGIDTLAPADSDPTDGITTYNFCADGSSSFSFDINALTNSTVTNLTMSWNNSIPNASFNISANGTQNPQATFNWTPTIADVSNSPFFFVVTVFDDACPLLGSFSYSYQVNLTNSSGSFVSTDVSCFGNQDGEIDLSVVGGSPPYNFFWWDSVSGFTSNSEDLINLDIGDYYCFIVDNLGDTLGCGIEPIYVPITEPQELIVNSVSSDVSCFGLNDGFIDLTISGGIPPYNVSWLSTNGTIYNTEDISSLPPDIYTATITDANNCGPLFETVSISEPSEITLYGNSSDLSCFGYNDGSIDLTTNIPGIIYNWIGPNGFTSNLEDINSLLPGTYTVSTSDLNGCIGPSQTFVILEPSDILVTYSSNNVSCYGGNDGSIDLTITGGAGNYTTIWNSPNGYFNISEDAFSLIAGPYTYSVLDANGCSPSINNSPIFISQPVDVQISSVVTDETCYGDADGSIDMTISGPSTYTYSWVGPNSFSSTNLDLIDLAAGNYNLTITDANNCQTQITENINIGNIILIDTFINHVSCNGSNDGSIVVLSQNSLNTTYSWLGPNGFTSSNSQIFNLTGGIYSLLVNDISNCPTQVDISITEPSILTLNSVITDESCEGYQDGEIQVTVSGGIPNYTYVWSNGITDSINSNLINGEYILNVFDDNNCIVTDTFKVSLFLFDTTRTINHVSCYGGMDGSIDLEVVGGNPPFIYNWNNGNNTQDLTNLSSAVYSVDITDVTNCTISRDVIITSPQQLVAVTNITSILCFGDSTGTASLQINGGVSPYVLDWGTTDTTSMWAGFHSYIVTDANNCKYTDSVEILQNDSMEISSNITDIQCYGDFTGSIEIQIAQGTGTPPYNYNWSGPNNFSSISEDIYNLESGLYILTVTDNNFCTQELQLYVDQSLQLTQITNILTSNFSGYHVRCKGENSAWIQLDVSGGYAPYSYLWDNGSQTDSIYDLYAGSYSVEITDSLGCKENLSINLYEPSTYVDVDIVPTSDFNGYNISCFGFNDGSLNANAFDGVPPYTYLWNTEEVSSSIFNLYSGYYEVFVYDNNQCLAIDSITLTQPTELFFDLEYYIDTCSRGVGKSEFIASGGVPPYNAIWSNGATDIVVDNLLEGEYFVEVFDDNLCIKKDTFSIENLEGPVAEFEAYPYHKRFFDQQNEPFYFVDFTKTFMSRVESWYWDFGDGTFANDSVVSHSYSTKGWFDVHLQIETEDNCIDTISKKVLVDEFTFYIPNTIIPLSNIKENSIFKGYGTGVKEYELKVFSRWGELIFETKDLNVGWDGTYFNNDKLCPVGIYTYTVFIENIYGEIFEYEGQVKLLR